MSTTDELLRNAESYAASFDKGDLPLPPARKIAVLACMDARLNPYGLLGLHEGDATSSATRAAWSPTTDCGMLTFTDDEFKRSVQDDVGIKPEWAAEAFPDLDEDLRQSVARIKSSPFIPRKDSVRGFVYEVESRRLREVT
jgi:carbonic anhydrase